MKVFTLCTHTKPIAIDQHGVLIPYTTPHCISCKTIAVTQRSWLVAQTLILRARTIHEDFCPFHGKNICYIFFCRMFSTKRNHDFYSFSLFVSAGSPPKTAVYRYIWPGVASRARPIVIIAAAAVRWSPYFLVPGRNKDKNLGGCWWFMKIRWELVLA